MDWAFLVGTEWIALLCFDYHNDSVLTDSEKKIGTWTCEKEGQGEAKAKLNIYKGVYLPQENRHILS